MSFNSTLGFYKNNLRCFVLTSNESGVLEILNGYSHTDITGLAGTNLLLTAISRNYRAVVNMLLQKGVDPNCIRCDQKSPLEISTILLSDCFLTKRLLDHGANPNVTVHNKPLLFTIISNGSACNKIAEILLSNHNTDINPQDQHGSTLLDKVISCNNYDLEDIIIHLQQLENALSTGDKEINHFSNKNLEIFTKRQISKITSGNSHKTLDQFSKNISDVVKYKQLVSNVPNHSEILQQVEEKITMFFSLKYMAAQTLRNYNIPVIVNEDIPKMLYHKLEHDYNISLVTPVPVLAEDFELYAE